MTTLRLVFAEIRYRLLNVLLGMLAVAVAAALFVAGPTLLGGYAKDTNDRLAKMQQATDKQLKEMDSKTKRIMRDMGVNLRILHKDTQMGGLYTDFQAKDFNQDYVDKLAHAPSIETIVHVVPTLQEKIKWQGRNILVIGVEPVSTDAMIKEGKTHMAQKIEPGVVLVGSELGQGLKEGDTIDVEGHSLKVKRIMPESGTQADASLTMSLADAQQALGREGKINMITALSCKCKGDRISAIRKELEGVLPDTKIVEINNLATAREMQRDLVVEKSKQQKSLLKEDRERTEATMAALVEFSTPLVVLASAVFVGLLTWLNVRERRPEIGLLRALGKGTASIAAMFLGKAVLLGLLGGLLGAGIGYMAAIFVGGSMKIPAELFRADPWILAATILGAPVIAAVASYLPTLVAVSQDPAVVLMDN